MAEPRCTSADQNDHKTDVRRVQYRWYSLYGRDVIVRGVTGWRRTSGAIDFPNLDSGGHEAAARLGGTPFPTPGNFRNEAVGMEAVEEATHFRALLLGFVEVLEVGSGCQALADVAVGEATDMVRSVHDG